MEALILVDLQNDFLPGGALAVPEGDQVIEVANRLIPKFELVIATQDFHPANHQSFASQHSRKEVGEIIQLEGQEQILWPDHCISGTNGAELASNLLRERISHVVPKGTDPNIDSYSGFFDNGHRQVTGLHDLLQSHNINRLFIMGLATDYCVKFTVLDALQLGHKVHLIQDGCRGVNLNEGDVAHAIQQMQTSGARIINSDEIS